VVLEVGEIVDHQDEKILVCHGCDKYLLPNGTVDLSEVEVVYFDLYVLAKAGSKISLWRDGIWDEVDVKVVGQKA
jgi:hypothetical protein